MRQSNLVVIKLVYFRKVCDKGTFWYIDQSGASCRELEMVVERKIARGQDQRNKTKVIVVFGGGNGIRRNLNMLEMESDALINVIRLMSDLFDDSLILFVPLYCRQIHYDHPDHRSRSSASDI